MSQLPEVKFPADIAAYAIFLTIVEPAFRKMQQIGSYVFMASSPDFFGKFNAYGYYTGWRGVQIDDAYWERAEYRHDYDYGWATASISQKGGSKKKRSRSYGKERGSRYYPDDNMETGGVVGHFKGNTQPALDILDELQALNWRARAEGVLKQPLASSALALVVQEQARFVAMGGALNGPSGTWLIDRDARPRFIGIPDRIHGELGKRGGPDIFGTLTAEKVEILLDYIPDLLDDLEQEPWRDAYARRHHE